MEPTLFNFMAGTGGFLFIIFIILGIFLSILWTILPFAIFGIKPRLEEIKNEIKVSNKKLSDVENELKAMNELLKEVMQNKK